MFTNSKGTGYDSLKRLTEARTVETQAGFGSWGVAFSYDGFGNLTGQTAVGGMAQSPPSLSGVTVDKMKNRMTGIGGIVNNITYDANGNMTSSPPHGTMTYDVDNRLETTGSGERYGYGSGNLRRWRIKAGRTAQQAEIYFYGLNGQLVATWGWQIYDAGTGAFFLEYRSAEPVVPKGLQVSRDRLGNVMFSAGTRYLPYGEIWPGGGPSVDGDGFGTYRRDVSTGLDYAVNRYFSTKVNRFTTADPYEGSGDAADPGSWSRYLYVQGDPINYLDPLGLIKCGQIPWTDIGGLSTRAIMTGTQAFSLLAGIMWHEPGPMYADDSIYSVREEQLWIGTAMMNRLAMSRGEMQGVGNDGKLYAYRDFGGSLSEVILKAGGNNLSWGIFSGGALSGAALKRLKTPWIPKSECPRRPWSSCRPALHVTACSALLGVRGRSLTEFNEMEFDEALQVG